jgi:hypothetical protein
MTPPENIHTIPPFNILIYQLLHNYHMSVFITQQARLMDAAIRGSQMAVSQAFEAITSALKGLIAELKRIPWPKLMKLIQGSPHGPSTPRRSRSDLRHTVRSRNDVTVSPGPIGKRRKTSPKQYWSSSTHPKVVSTHYEHHVRAEDDWVDEEMMSVDEADGFT